ncbi:hypothetical protein PGTUg99_050188 [Puccinia graminis f. sp. tritici]|uniref:Uncharacterized protein n=1 Tax=Puccinia graminis f. sp. tritici TaxID=56615 RepID=A0A5B0Q4S7_PUCGR|nr:hypothetical protein PGTUg99_050188 [Puccinia graminis f. sp. tritici]
MRTTHALLHLVYLTHPLVHSISSLTSQTIQHVLFSTSYWSLLLRLFRSIVLSHQSYFSTFPIKLLL